jgi:hypothetical protein
MLDVPRSPEINERYMSQSWISCSISFADIGLSFNQPKFSPYASWNPNATTLPNSNGFGAYAQSLFIDQNNTIHVPQTNLDRVQVWREGNSVPVRNLSNGLHLPQGIFVTSNGDSYVDNSALYRQIVRWRVNETNSTVVTTVDGDCRSIFVDTNDTIYCAITFAHKVVKKYLPIAGLIPILAAGIGVAGATATQFNCPSGIFVDLNFNLYVADTLNNRIQMFVPNGISGTTVAGNGAPGIMTTNGPTGVTLDADGYLFISELYGNRILGSGPNGFRCLVGCTGIAGAAMNQLNYPWTLALDSYGNIYVADKNNDRIQKFSLATNSSGICPCLRCISCIFLFLSRVGVQSTSIIVVCDMGLQRCHVPGLHQNMPVPNDCLHR